MFIVFAIFSAFGILVGVVNIANNNIDTGLSLIIGCIVSVVFCCKFWKMEQSINELNEKLGIKKEKPKKNKPIYDFTNMTLEEQANYEAEVEENQQSEDGE